VQSYDAMMQPFFVTDTFFDKTYHFLQKGWKYPKEQDFIYAKWEQPLCGTAPIRLLNYI